VWRTGAQIRRPDPPVDTSWTALGLARALREGERSAVEVVRELLDRLDRLRPVIGAVAAVDPKRSLADADAADRRLRAGEARALEGVPFTVKDWIDVAGWPISGSVSASHPGDRERRPAVDASAVARLRAAGGVMLAVTRVWADSPAHGPTRNPHEPSRNPGGSSSGAAALVAARASPVALGSDSGGSIRLPAAWCGVAGLKPTYGRVPLTGHFPRLGALEDGRTVIGPLARTVDDLAVVLAQIAGPDGLDAGVAPVPLGDPGEVDLSALRVAVVPPHEICDFAGTPGVPPHEIRDFAGTPGVPPHEIRDFAGTPGVGGGPTAVAASALLAAGADIVDDKVPDVRDEALELTRRYWARAELTGSEYVRVLWDWDRFRRRVLVATAGIDVVICPAAAEPAPPWREWSETDYQWTLPWSLTGAPAVVVPVGTQGGLPVAVQVVGRPWQDHVALAAARCVEAFAPRVPYADPFGPAATLADTPTQEGR